MNINDIKFDKCLMDIRLMNYDLDYAITMYNTRFSKFPFRINSNKELISSYISFLLCKIYGVKNVDIEYV